MSSELFDAPNNAVLQTIVIDPGHGGHDPGNLGTGRYKATEKDIALDVSLKLGEYLSKGFPDMNIIYTRKTDKFIGLKERTAIANKAEADLFVSVHCNSFKNPESHGTETFVMGLHKSESNLKLAQKENSTILLEENYEGKYEGFDPKSPESLISRALAQSAYLDQSLNLSAKIQTQYTDRVQRTNRGVKQAGFWVISYTTMPSVLTELGFLTNKDEEDYLNSDKGKVFMASALFRAVRDYKAEVDKVFEEKKINDQPKNKSADAKPTLDKPAPKLSKPKLEAPVYKVQILASSKQLPLSEGQLGKVKDLQEVQENGFYKYMAGNHTDFNQAMSARAEIRELGFADAYVIAFHKGKKISASEALKLSKKLNN